MINIIAIATGGALGAVLRHFAAKTVTISVGFPVGVLLVNLIGCFLLGIFIEILALKINLPEYLKLFITVGLLGAFTTFSTFILEILLLNQQNGLKILTAYLISSVLGGIICMLFGIHAIKLLTKLF